VLLQLRHVLNAVHEMQCVYETKFLIVILELSILSAWSTQNNSSQPKKYHMYNSFGSSPETFTGERMLK
jgi:hypothetical protein